MIDCYSVFVFQRKNEREERMKEEWNKGRGNGRENGRKKRRKNEKNDGRGGQRERRWVRVEGRTTGGNSKQQQQQQ